MKTYLVVDMQSKCPLRPETPYHNPYDYRAEHFNSFKEAVGRAEQEAGASPGTKFGVYQLLAEAECHVAPATSRLVE